MDRRQVLRARNDSLPRLFLNFSGSRFVCHKIGVACTGLGTTMREAYNDWYTQMRGYEK